MYRSISVLLSEYRQHPDDFYLLRIGYGGTMGPLTDIDQEGFMSPAFHSFPDRLDFDPVSGDNGPNLFGHVWNTATYVVNHPEFGWLAFGGNRRVESDVVKVKPLDSARTRVYLAPLGVWLTLDAGQFETVEMNCKNGSVRMGLAPASRFTPTARLRIGQPAIIKGIKTYRPGKSLQSQRGAFLVPLSGGTTWVALGQEP